MCAAVLVEAIWKGYYLCPFYIRKRASGGGRKYIHFPPMCANKEFMRAYTHSRIPPHLPFNARHKKVAEYFLYCIPRPSFRVPSLVTVDMGRARTGHARIWDTCTNYIHARTLGNEIISSDICDCITYNAWKDLWISYEKMQGWLKVIMGPIL